jgi:hypothetical protein
MSSNKKEKNNFLVNRKKFLAGVQALTIFLQDKTNVYLQVRKELGDEHPAVEQMREELDTLESMVNFFSELVRDQNTGDSNHYN